MQGSALNNWKLKAFLGGGTEVTSYDFDYRIQLLTGQGAVQFIDPQDGFGGGIGLRLLAIGEGLHLLSGIIRSQARGGGAQGRAKLVGA